MKMQSIVKMVVAASFILLVSGCSADTKGQEEKGLSTASVKEQEGEGKILDSVALHIGFSTGEDDPRVLAAKQFKEEVEEKTEGRIMVYLHPDGELGSDAELIKGIIDESVDMTVSSAGNFANYVNEVGVSAFPFLFSDFEEAWTFMDSELMTTLDDKLEEYNIHVLSYFDNGFRCVTTSQKAGPVEKAADMKGLKIRTPENQIVMETMAELGANPHVYDFTKLYEALKNKEFDAQENPVPVIYNHKLYEVQSYLAITNHSYDAMPFVIRQDLWEDLKAEDQEIISAAAISAQERNRQMVKEQTEDYEKRLEKEGMTITYPDLEEFKEATVKVYDYFADSYGEELMEAVKKQEY